MTEKCRQSLARVDWSRVELLDAQAIYTLTATCCRATKGRCFCGCHTTELDPLIPAGNQAKAPTALDEMRALSMAKLVESRSTPEQDAIAADCGCFIPEPAACQKDAWYCDMARATAERLTVELRESSEALARVEAERDELRQSLAWERGWDLHRKAAMGAVIEAARGYMTALRYGNGYGPLERMRAALSALDQAASEAEVTERAFTEGQRVELNIGGQWRSGVVLQLGIDPDRYLVKLDVPFRDDDEYGVHASSLRPWVSDPEATESAPRER